jgi:hypothetical protein
MNRMGRDTVSVVMDKLPILNKVIRWFKGDDMNIDNHLFKLHYQASTLMIAIGFIVISEKNYLDLPQKSILCHSDKTLSEYAKSYCWIHGTSYVRKALQGKATGCFVDQTKIESEEDAPVTAYYLWLPYLLTICFILARLPRSAWKRFFENKLILHILKGKSENVAVQGRGNQGGQVNTAKKAAEIAENFLDYRPKYAKYHFWFGFCEVCNIFCVGLSMFFCNWLLNYQFALYGLKVLEYLGTIKRVNQLGQYVTHDPMCELFPTEVACTLRYGATTGALDRSNFLCILGNNLFNQKYFFVLWLWWAFLLLFSALGVVYRAARMTVPGFSRIMLMRKVHGQQLATLMLSASEYFVLDLMVQNMESRQMELVLGEVEKQYKKRMGQKMGKMSDSLPSVIIDEPAKPSAPRHGSDSSGFGSGKGEPTKGDYMTLAQKSPVKQQGQSPNGKALSSPQNAVLKESYFPKRALVMGDMDMVDHGGVMLGCGSTTSDTSESTSLSTDSDCNFSVVTFESGQTEV